MRRKYENFPIKKINVPKKIIHFLKNPKKIIFFLLIQTEFIKKLS